VTIEGVSHLYQALYTAIEANDAQTFNDLVQQHRADIRAQIESWATVPAAIRTDQKAVTRYAQSLMAIAQALEAIGEPALMERLVGPDETNSVVQWQRRLSHAQALSAAGEYAASDSQLEQVLAEMEGATGTAVVNLRPKILGRLGFNALHEQDHAAALNYTARAYDACLAAEDEEGIVAYYENLMSLRVIQALDAEPERGQRLLDVRRLIARAQDSADAGRYHASINMLSQALSVIQSQNDDELFRALLPKIYGLLGFNEYKLGNSAKAREHSALALKESETIGDMDGVRIYTANLEAINRC
jgi:tetratricopeptide (TPR) repeat protein